MNEEDPRIERFARALCVADGCNPDVLVLGGDGYVLCNGPRGSIVVMDHPQRISWQLYWRDARAVVEELDKT